MAGIALVDVSSGGLVPGVKIPVGPGYQAHFAAEIRRRTGLLPVEVADWVGRAEAEPRGFGIHRSQLNALRTSMASWQRRQEALLAGRQVELLLELGEGAVHVLRPRLVLPVLAQADAGLSDALFRVDQLGVTPAASFCVGNNPACTVSSVPGAPGVQ